MSDSTWYPRDSEAESLATQLRTQRLTLLFGEPGSGKTTLLTAGVLPLLHRRVTDELSGIGANGSGVVLPFPDRRLNEDGSFDSADTVAVNAAKPQAQRVDDTANPMIGPDGEVAVFFDGWDDAPLEGLLSQMREALSYPTFDGARRRRSLASTLGSFHRQRGGKSLIVLDRFEDYLVQPENAPGIRQFGDALVDAMNRPGLPVHFLISLNEDAVPLLERFRGRIAGLDDHCMRLPPLQRPGDGPPAIPVLRQVPDGYRPPIDLELPNSPAPPAIQPGDPVRHTGPGALHPEPLITPPEFATSRQPEWMDSAFSSPAASSQMNTKDVYASMEALLGRIVQGTKEAEDRVAQQSADGANAVADSTAAAAPLSSSPDAGASSRMAPERAEPQPSMIDDDAAGAGAEAAIDPAEVARALRREAAAQQPPTQVWPPSTVARQPEAAAEFAPLFTFESGVKPPPKVSRPADAAARSRAASARAAPAHGDVDHVVESRPPEPDSAPPLHQQPAGADWLSEVHASLTKLSHQPDESGPETMIQGESGQYEIRDATLSGSGTTNSPGRAIAIAVVFVLVVLALVAGSAFLPPEFRPFELPASMMSALNGLVGR